jgi:hypothetical protein
MASLSEEDFAKLVKRAVFDRIGLIHDNGERIVTSRGCAGTR